MEIVNPSIEAFLYGLQKTTDPVLCEMEERAAKERFPIIGPLVGRVCRLLAHSIQARNVFEAGSGFGYSTVWFAQAVGEGGRVVHTDNDPKKSEDARNYLGRAGLAGRVRFEVGDALTILEASPGPFDIVFIDIDKHAYPRALELAHARVREGGYIITDNTLWSGKIVDPAMAQDRNTQAVLNYDQEAFAAPDLYTVILPLRDGVAVSLKLTGLRKL
jgi:caffeoyl-CoA O-methyltransferase